VPRDLSVADVAAIVELAGRAQARRKEIIREMRAAVQRNDRDLLMQLAQSLCRVEDEAEDSGG
jgi:hypothetical protein